MRRCQRCYGYGCALCGLTGRMTGAELRAYESTLAGQGDELRLRSRSLLREIAAAWIELLCAIEHYVRVRLR